MPTIVMIVVLLASLLVVAAGADFPVLDGEQQAIIVFDPDAKRFEPEWTRDYEARSEAHPQEELAEYLEKATGHKFEVVVEADFEPGVGKFPIYVGPCAITRQTLGEELAQLHREGFMIVVEPARVFLVGPRRLSTYWAVCQFLEDYVGVRWLIPGPLGEDILPQERIVIAPTHRVEVPAMLSRAWSGAGKAPGGVTWSFRQRVSVGIYPKYRFSHQLGKIFPPDEYYEQHPEFYPILNGKRWQPGQGRWQPCMTEPGTVKVAAQAARDYWAEHPDMESFALGMADNHSFCQCADCAALWQPKNKFGGRYSLLYFSWLDKVAREVEKTNPDKLLGCLAYGPCVPPPEGIELDRSILPYITFTIADTYAPRYRDAVRELVELWGAKVDQIGQYDYAYGIGFVLPRIYTHLVQDTIRDGVKHNLKGAYAEVYPNWGLDGPRLYLTARIWWNPDVDIDALFDDWNERMFREAAEPMKKYFRRCEEAWVSYRGYDQWADDFYLFLRTPQFEVYTPEVLEECTGYLDEAARLAKSELVKERLHFFRKTWDLGLVFANAYWPNKTIRWLVENDEPIQLMANALQRLPKTMTAEDFKREIQQRIANDKVAFAPIKENWLPVPGGRPRILGGVRTFLSSAAAKTYPWCVERLTPPAVEQARANGRLSAEAVRHLAEQRIAEVFPATESPTYQEVVADIRTMALKVVGVAKASAAPKIDGQLDDKTWAEAIALSGFTVTGGMVATRYDTTVRLAHDGRDLYVAFDCSRKAQAVAMTPAGDVEALGMATPPTERDGAVADDDYVAIILRSAQHPETWARFMVNPAGALLDEWNDGSGRNSGYDFDCEWAAQAYPDHWTVEMRLPLAEMKISPTEEPVVRMNLVRQVRGVRSIAEEISTWYPEPLRGWHWDLDNQGWLILE